MSFSNPGYKRAGAIFFHDEVEPKEGSILYCKLTGIPNPLGTPEHTGVYVGGNNIVELNGNGNVMSVSVKEFLGFTASPSFTRLGSMYAYVACDQDGKVLHDPQVAKRAISKLGTTRSYNFLMDNCHQFTTGCITGDFENPHNFFWMLEESIKDHFHVSKIKWLVAKENVQFEPLDKSAHTDQYSYESGVTKFYFDYVPFLMVRDSHPVVTDELIGANFTPSKTEMYIKLTGHKLMGAWHWYDEPITLVDVTLNKQYTCGNVIPYKKKGVELRSPRIGKGQNYVHKLIFPKVNESSVFRLKDGQGEIYSSSFKFKKR